MKAKKWKKLYGIDVTFTCPYCMKQYPLYKATIEHEPPRSRQKELGESNKTLACSSCNHEKGALTAQEYELWKVLEDIRLHGI